MKHWFIKSYGLNQLQVQGRKQQQLLQKVGSRAHFKPTYYDLPTTTQARDGAPWCSMKTWNLLKDSNVVCTGPTVVSFYNSRPINKISHSNIMIQPNNNSKSSIWNLLIKLSILDSNLSPKVLITELLNFNHRLGTSGMFDRDIAREDVRLLSKKALKVILRH